MNQIEGILLLTGIPLGLLLAGYWLAATFEQSDVQTRLSIALLTGTASLLLAVSIVNYFLPISGIAAWACLAPVYATLLRRKGRSCLWHDLRSLFVSRSAWGYGAVITLFFVLLLWPVLSSFTTLMYDGTSNHDSFFWITVAEHLKRHTYMEQPLFSPLQPLASAADAVVGWKPAWGRMGAEGLFALCSAIVGLSPLKLYLYATACLFLPWLAVVHLAIRTFYAERLSWPAQIAVLVLHPIFIFFYSNSNLPNLLGVITGSTAIIATELALRAGRERRSEALAWSAVLALALHGLYCSYSEMIPFVFLPCCMLWLRSWFTAEGRAAWRPKLLVAGAVIVSMLLNPASTFRAGWGFYAAYLSARADDRWGNIMDQLHPAQYLPALGTLAAPAAKWLGVWAGGSLTLLIVIGIGLVWRRARDPIGALLAFSGGCALLVYTVVAHFVYGWQKSVQFTGIFVTAVVSGVIIDAIYQQRSRTLFTPGLTRAASAALMAFLAFAVGMQCREIYKWSDRKMISQDWFALRDLSRTTLGKMPVLVEAASFRMAFYHGMWAAYFLPDSHIYFAARGEQSGGYLRDKVINEASHAIPHPTAVLVSRMWADSFDANSPRILLGKEYALLSESNRVFKMGGVFPLNGPPDVTSSLIELEVQPYMRSELVLVLQPRKPEAWPANIWRVSRRTEGAADFSAEISGRPPWTIKIPMEAGKRNQIRIASATVTEAEMPFVVKTLRIEASP